MRNKIEKVLDNHIDYYGTSKEDLLNELCNLFGVRKSFTAYEIVKVLEDCDHLDDAIMYFN